MKRFPVIIAVLMLFTVVNICAYDAPGLYLDFTSDGAAFDLISGADGCDVFYNKDEQALEMDIYTADTRFFISCPGDTELSDYPFIRIELKNETSSEKFEMYLATNGKEITSEANCFKRVITSNDKEYKTYIWNASEITPSLWRGKLTTWRFDCLNNASNGEIIYIKSIGFFASEADAEGFSGGTVITDEPTQKVTDSTVGMTTDTSKPVSTATVTDAADTTADITQNDGESGLRIVMLICGTIGNIAAVSLLIYAVLSHKLRNKYLLAICAVLLLLSTAAIIISFKIKGEEKAGEDTTKGETVTEIINPEDLYKGAIVERNGVLAGVDSLGRVLSEDVVKSGAGEKTVGMFYFLWLGVDGEYDIHDNTETIKKDPTAYESEEKWLAAGGAGIGEPAFWGKPLLGYYSMNDEWVIRKHAQMLSCAGVDYIVFDTTNTSAYVPQALLVLKVFDEFYKQGIDVPQIAFYSNTNSAYVVNKVYREIYTDHPEYSHLWFKWDGKPMIIGRNEDDNIKPEAREFFTMKQSLWPNEKRSSDDSWPWIEFDRLYKKSAIYGKDGRREVISVSTAQHCDTTFFSQTAWYGGNDHTKSWHNGKNDTSENSVLYGYNFADQWEWAIEQDPETIFVTQFNEWAAVWYEWEYEGLGAIKFFDCADIQNSRDIEPMSGGYGDNYFMQLCSYIRKYKGISGRVDVGDNKSVDINGDFSQFDAATAVYTDPTCDTNARNSVGFGKTLYKDESGRNDIETIKVVKDAEHICFYIKTAQSITSPEGEAWMTIFIDAGEGASWEGYEYMIGGNVENGKRDVFKCASDGQYVWEKVGKADIRCDGDEMAVKVAKTDIAQSGIVDIRFKVADNFTPGDIYSFYTSGDCAPYGRFNFVFSNKK